MFFILVGWPAGKLAFIQLADLLNIEVITLKSRPHPLQSFCPAFYLSAPSRLVCRLVQHRWDRRAGGGWCHTTARLNFGFDKTEIKDKEDFEWFAPRFTPASVKCWPVEIPASLTLLCVCCYFFSAFVIVYDLIILVNAVFIGLDEENPMISNSEWFFLALYLLEILLKLYVIEPRSFFSKHSFWNWWGQVDDVHHLHFMSLLLLLTAWSWEIVQNNHRTQDSRYCCWSGVHVDAMKTCRGCRLEDLCRFWDQIIDLTSHDSWFGENMYFCWFIVHRHYCSVSSF